MSLFGAPAFSGMTARAVVSIAGPRGVRRFLAELEQRLEHQDRAILVAEWDLFTGRSRAGAERRNLKRSRLISDERHLP